MNDIDNENEQRTERLKKILKGLPEVQASSDFEARLQRRISAEEHAPGLWERIFAPRRVPVFAYSLATIIAVGLISYYVVWRTGNAPMPMEPETPSGKLEKKSPLSSDQEAKPADKLDDGRKDMDKPALIHHNEAPVASQLNRRMAEEAENNEITARANKEASQDDKREISIEPQYQAPAGVANSGSKIMLRDAADELKAKDAFKSVTAPSVQQFGAMQEKGLVASELDSAALADTLKMDSLQKAQFRLHQQQKQQLQKARKRK